ncbi:MAG: hypothetical protein ACUVQV_09120, partial [Dissulfurimicrobium sp.]|uniref:hypothetical protein n=1 Tax=Dissulfurimicrobium sp. TaxID=2022436 RepID=UPI004049D89F
MTDAFGEDVTPTIRGMKLASAIAIYQTKRIIIGHFGFVPGESLPQGYYWATVLRNPRERTISDYYFQVENVPPASLSLEEQRIKNMSLEEFLFDTTMVQRVYNYQAVHFASFFHPTPQHLPTNELFALAKRGLDQYHLVG